MGETLGDPSWLQPALGALQYYSCPGFSGDPPPGAYMPELSIKLIDWFIKLELDGLYSTALVCWCALCLR